MSRWRMRRGERGAALLEMAISVMLLLVLVFGIIDFGLLLKDYLALSQVAREAARTAGLGGDAVTTATTWATKLGLHVDRLQTPVVEELGTDPDRRVSVNLAYTHRFVLSFIFGESVTLRTSMVMRWEYAG